MKDAMKYKDYIGSVHYDGEDEIFHGRLEFIRDLVTFEGSDAKSLKKAFIEAVDDYLDFCAEQNKEPDKPFKGSFNVRTGAELHRYAALLAKEMNTSLNTVVVKALEDYVKKTSKKKPALAKGIGNKKITA